MEAEEMTSLENLVFDPTLYVLAGLTIVFSISSFFLALRAQRKLAQKEQRAIALGNGLVAIGFATIIVTAISLLVLFRSGFIGGFTYLQVEFSIVYIGCALIIFGVNKTLFRLYSETISGGLKSGTTRRSVYRVALWIVFFVSVGIALAYLFN